MLKGVRKQVLVVRPQESAFFEEAVFFVKPAVSRKGEPDIAAFLKEAEQIAGCPVTAEEKKKRPNKGLFKKYKHER